MQAETWRAAQTLQRGRMNNLTIRDSEALLKRSDHFKKKAQELLQRGIVPRENGWGGWLGRYQRALSEAAENVEFQQNTRQEDHTRQLTWHR